MIGAIVLYASILLWGSSAVPWSTSTWRSFRWGIEPAGVSHDVDRPYPVKSMHFWPFIHPVIIVTLLAAIGLNWETMHGTSSRWPEGYVLAVLLPTAIWFVPELLHLINPETDLPSEQWRRRAKRWEALSLARGVVVLALIVPLLIAVDIRGEPGHSRIVDFRRQRVDTYDGLETVTNTAAGLRWQRIPETPLMTSRSRRTLSASSSPVRRRSRWSPFPPVRTPPLARRPRPGDRADHRRLREAVPRRQESNRPPDGACRGTSNSWSWGVGPLWTGKTFRKGMVVNRGLAIRRASSVRVKRIGKRTWKIDYQPMTVNHNVVVDILHKRPWGYQGEIYAWGICAGDFQLHCPKSMMKKKSTKTTKSSTTKDQEEDREQFGRRLVADHRIVAYIAYLA